MVSVVVPLLEMTTNIVFSRSRIFSRSRTDWGSVLLPEK